MLSNIKLQQSNVSAYVPGKRIVDAVLHQCKFKIMFTVNDTQSSCSHHHYMYFQVIAQCYDM